MERQENATVGFEDIRTGRLRFVDYLGIECSTAIIDKAGSPIPFFFLFADIDEKDPELLRQTLDVFARHAPSFYWYETQKGWHVISPSLLHASQWEKARLRLKEFLDNYYLNLVIRIERREGDSRILNYDNYNLTFDYLESESLHKIIHKKFGKQITAIPSHWVPSRVQFVKYTQSRLEL